MGFSISDDIMIAYITQFNDNKLEDFSIMKYLLQYLLNTELLHKHIDYFC